MKLFITINYIIFFLQSQVFAHVTQTTYYDGVRIERLYSNIKKAQKTWCIDFQELGVIEGQIFTRDYLAPVHNDSNLDLDDALTMFEHMLSHDTMLRIRYDIKNPYSKRKTNYTKNETCHFLKQLSQKYSMKF